MASLVARLGVACAGVIPLALGTADCRAPTEVTVDLTTDVKCDHLQGVAIAVGKVGEVEDKPSTATQIGCSTEGHVGTLTVVPSGSNTDEVTIKIVGGVDRDPESCKAPTYGTGCIVARRTIRYVAHTPLVLDVPLRNACNGVICSPDQTCVSGACASSEIDTSKCGSGCGEVVLPPGATVQSPSPLVCGDSGGLEPSAPWPTLGFCPTRIGRGPRAGAQTGTIRWTADTGSAVGSGVVVAADGTIYVGAADGKLYAVSGTGAVKWSTAVGPALDPTVPAIAHDGTVYLVSKDANVTAVSPSGAVAWRAAIGGSAYTAPAVAPDGTLYLGGGKGPTSLTALDKTGKRRWQFTTGLDVYAAPAIALDGSVLIGSEDKQFYAVDPAGTQRWKFNVGDGAQSAIVAPNGWVYFAGKTSVCAVDGNGALKWVAQTKTDASTPALGPDGTVYAVQSGDGLVIAFDGVTGKPKWGTAIGAVNAANQPILGADGVLYMGSTTGKLTALGSNGKIKWQVTAGGGIAGPAAIGADGTVYFGSADHKLYAVGP
jgi:outer membrane protein assembly factor BamB